MSIINKKGIFGISWLILCGLGALLLWFFKPNIFKGLIAKVSPQAAAKLPDPSMLNEVIKPKEKASPDPVVNTQEGQTTIN